MFLQYMFVSFFIQIEGHLGGQKVNFFSIGQKVSNISNYKNKSVEIFYMDRET